MSKGIEKEKLLRLKNRIWGREMHNEEDFIVYKKGYKYQLQSTHVIKTQIYCGVDIECPFITLYQDGYLWIHNGYAWDGLTGVPDFDSGMRASLVHDALYQLMRTGRLNRKYKSDADILFYEILIQDETPHGVAALMYEGVKKLGDFATKASGERKLTVSPKSKRLDTHD